MTVLDHTTGEIIDAPTYGDVKASVTKALTSLEAAAEQIIWQIENRVWLVLGYANWNEMREAEYGGAAFMVPRAERPELVARMRRQGLTQKEIADTAGVNRETVAGDLRSMSESGIEVEPESITNSRGQQRPASYNKPAVTAGDVIEGRARYRDTEGGRADRLTLDCEAAVREFPDLEHYAQVDPERAVLMAEDLRHFRAKGELEERLDNLRRSVALDKAKRDGTYRPGTTAVMGEDGIYRMQPRPEPTVTFRPCPNCSGTGQIKENL